MQRSKESKYNPENIITSVKNDRKSRRSTLRSSRSVRVSIRSILRLVFCRPKKKRRSKDVEFPEGTHLLPRITKSIENKICLVVDLDETLVHSSFKPSKDADFVVPVAIEYHTHKVYVKKRPFVDNFIETIGPLFECVLFTASLSKYADPVVNLLDTKGHFRTRLFRESCLYRKGYYTKDLSLLGRNITRVLIIDNSPNSYSLHKENAIPIKTWISDQSDTELLKMIPLLIHLSTCDNIFTYLPKFVNDLQVNFDLVPNTITANNNVDSCIIASLHHKHFPHRFITRSEIRNEVRSEVGSEGKEELNFDKNCLFKKQIKLKNSIVRVSESMPVITKMFFSRPSKIRTISVSSDHFHLKKDCLTSISDKETSEEDIGSPIESEILETKSPVNLKFTFFGNENYVFSL